MPGLTNPEWYVEDHPTNPQLRDFIPTLARRLTNDSSPQYGIGVRHDGGSSVVRLLAMRTDAAGNVLHPHEIDFTVTPYFDLPNNLPATGTDVDDYPSEAIWRAVYRQGYLWATHCVGTGTPTSGLHRSIVRVYKFAMNNWNGPGTTTPQLLEVVDLDPGPGNSCFVPSIAVQQNGYAAISYNATSDAQNIRYYTHVRCNHASPWESAVLRYTHPAPIFGPAFPLRNPDYSGTVEDATVRSRFWMHHVPVGANTTILASNVQRFDGCGADFTGDGLVGGDDALVFGEFYVQGDPEADFEPDGAIDALDVVGYQEAGIP